jgi:hypothetical protein
MDAPSIEPPVSDPVRVLPRFLREGSFGNPQLASCGNHDHLALIYEIRRNNLTSLPVPSSWHGARREMCVHCR